MPRLAGDERDGGVLRAVIGEKVVKAEECESVLGGKSVTESGGVCEGEVRPGVEGSAAEAVESAGGVRSFYSVRVEKYNN